MSWWREAWLIARKDLTIELRSRVTINQVAPLGLLILVVFAFAFDQNAQLLALGSPGLFWVGVLFSGILTVQRAFTTEGSDGLTDALRLSGIGPASIYLGKTLAVAVQLLALEVVLLAGIIVLFDGSVEDWPLLGVSALVGTGAFAAAGCIYGALSLGLRVRETLLPLLLMPVVAPLLLAGSRAFEHALGVGDEPGWSLVGLSGVMFVVYLALGTLSASPLLEDG